MASKRVKKAGLPGVHFQLIYWGKDVLDLSGFDGNLTKLDSTLVENMGFESLTNYQFVHFTNIDRDYNEIIPDVLTEWKNINSEYHIEYYPHVSIGWDNNPRFKDFRNGIITNNTPENFEKALRYTKDYADKNSVTLITVNSWNEWTETGYLEPDDIAGCYESVSAFVYGRFLELI